MPGKTWRDVTGAQAAVIAALIGIVPAGISGIVSGIVSSKNSVAELKKELDPITQTRDRIIKQLPNRPGYVRYVYPNLGLGLQTPAQWTVEDYAATFAGGEFDIVKRYEDTKGIVGMKFRYRSVQKNYINDINAELENQRDVWKKIDPNLTLGDTTINGKPAKLWHYNQSTGERTGDIRWYWLRLIPEVKLEIVCFIYTDSKDRDEFWREVDEIMKSLVIDELHIGQRKALLHQDET